jgi:hypothetical protein
MAETKKTNQLVYICGPITKNPNSFRDFALAEEQINALGYKTINPHEICRHIDPNGFETPDDYWEACMRVCIQHIAICGLIVTLPGWEESKGAKKEVAIARELGFIDVKFFNTFITNNQK